MTRVLLVSPPFYRLLGGHNDWPALGLGYLAAVLNLHGVDARVYYADRLPSQEHVSLRELFSHQTQYLQVLEDPTHPLWEEVIERVLAFSPDLVGLSLVSPAVKSATLVARTLKDRNPKLQVVAGGPHATFAAQPLLESGAFDWVVRGEGEYTLLELAIGRDPATIAGLTFRDGGGTLHVNPVRPAVADLDTLPFPDSQHDLNPKSPGDDHEMIMTGRGCPYRCVFCASPRLWGRRVRLRTVQNVVAELRLAYDRDGTRLFYFIDDVFNIDERRAIDLCSTIVTAGLEIEWMCEARLDHLSRELLQAMRRAGCKRIKLGVESGSERVLRLMKKGIDLDQVRKAVALVKEAGIDLTLYFLLGFPGETADEAKQSIALARELDPTYCSLGIVSPYFGTELYDMLQGQGRLPENNGWERCYHQSPEMLRYSAVPPAILDEFLEFNERVGKSRL